MADYCLVFFRAGECDLDRAARELGRYGLTVARRSDELSAGRSGGPQFRIRLDTSQHVAIEAAEIGETTPLSAALRECAARFEIVINDLDAAFDEMVTLMEVQGALQDASRGYLFLPWNGNLVGPWQGEG